MEELEKVFELMVQSFPVANWYPKEISKIRELVNENSNLPLAFEELKKGMWVWDCVEKMFIKIRRIDVENKKVFVLDCLYIMFEEKRFYRRQMEE